MAVLQMQKISICALKKDRKAVLEKLQRMKVMEISQILEEDPDFTTMDTRQERMELEKSASLSDQALEILDVYKRQPLTYILEAADDLAYKTADIEDAFVKGFLSYHAFKEELVCLNEQYPDSGFDGVLKLKELYQRGQEKGCLLYTSFLTSIMQNRASGF